MVIEGIGMPGPDEVAFIEKGGEPGRVPIFVGTVIALFSLILIVQAIRDGGYRLLQAGTVNGDMRKGILRSSLAAIGCSAYAVGLLGARIGGWHVPYEYATVLFIALFIVGFDWQDAREYGAARWAGIERRWPDFARNLRSSAGESTASIAPYLWLIAMALLQAAIMTAAITYLFEQEFYVTMP